MAQYRTSCDFETRSLADLRTLGSAVYAQHPSTVPLMLAFRTKGLMERVNVLDFFAIPGYPELVLPRCPPEILAAIARGDTFVAHNARFEQDIYYHICHKKWGWPLPAKWSCTAARARYWGIRASLEGAGSDLEIVSQKLSTGKDFIDMFCKPREYKGAKKLGIIKTPWMDPHDTRPQEARVKGKLKDIVVPAQEWQKGIQYCAYDVLAEEEIDEIIPDLPEFEQRIWELNFNMNMRGIPIDTQSVERAIRFTEHFTDQNITRFNAITGVNPTQRQKILDYLEQREEIENLGDLKSKTLKRIVQDDLPEDLRDVINIRLEAAMASVKKLDAMRNRADADGRVRGTILYRGAHTGRDSSKGLQVQNFKRSDLKVQKAMFRFLEQSFWDSTLRIGHNGGPPLDDMPSQPEWVYEAGLRFTRPLGALSKSMRGFIKAPPGKKILSGDYAQIEARVLAWLARVMWLLNAFRNGDDVYTRFGAEFMYNKRYEDCIKIENGKAKVQDWFAPNRQKAKSAVLGCGFQVSGRGFMEYCDNIDLIISESEAKEIVRAYRKAHPEIADWERGLWTRLERAAIRGATGEYVQLANTGITFHTHRLDSERWWLICTLPSGRHIAYYRPKVRLGEKFGKPCEILSFRTEWNGKSFREDTYGGKITENVVQGIARDVMYCGALNAEAAGYPLIGVVHDEIITLPDMDFGSAPGLVQQMCALPPWITDCPVEAEGAEMLRYGK